jgi:hypothetical protein
MARISSRRNPAGDGTPFPGDEDYEECPICHQEFAGVCPIKSADCPFLSGNEPEEEDEEDEDGHDFEDVDSVDKLLEDDEDVEKLIEEDGEEIPPEDLEDEG